MAETENIMDSALDAGCVDSDFMRRIYSRYLNGASVRDIVLDLARNCPGASPHEDDVNRIIDHMNETSLEPAFVEEPEYELHIWGGDQFDCLQHERIPMAAVPRSVFPDTHIALWREFEARLMPVPWEF